MTHLSFNSKQRKALRSLSYELKCSDEEVVRRALYLLTFCFNQGDNLTLLDKNGKKYALDLNPSIITDMDVYVNRNGDKAR